MPWITEYKCRFNIQTSRHKNKQTVIGVVSSVLTVLPVFIEETVYEGLDGGGSGIHYSFKI